MVIKRDELDIKKFDNLRGGNGTVEMQYIIQGEKLKNNCKPFSKITIPPGGSIGMHDHTTDY